MTAAVAVIGEGMLADFVCEELAASYRIHRQSGIGTVLPVDAALVLVLHDAWHPSVHQQAEERFPSAGVPWLRGFVSYGEAVLGPLVRPGLQGCSQCADMRLLMAGTNRMEMRVMRQSMAEHGGRVRDAWASRTGLLQAAHLLAAEAERVLLGEPGGLDGRMLLVNLKTLKSSRHLFLPDPMCPVCGRLPQDSPEAAQISLRPSPKIRPGSYRSRSMDELKTVLEHDYWDYRTGMLNVKMHDLTSLFADATVNLPLLHGDEGTAGRTHSYAESELTAILEGLERYCGLTPRGKRTVVRDSYRSLAEEALNPIKVGVHDKKQYARPGFPFKPFDPRREMDWVWGYSFLQERPILVPELLAYYSLGGGHGFVYETSNGCALGGSLEEAIFYGIMEIVERDAFLMTWYAQLPLPRLDPYSTGDKELRLMIDRMRTVAGYDVLVYNATMENGIPTVWAIAKNRKPQGANLICAAGAHPDPVRALKSSVSELAGTIYSLNDKFEADREEYVRMYHDSSLVRQMEHHSMLYGLPEAEERLQFLLDDRRPLRTFDEEFEPAAGREDLTDDLRDILGKFRQLNLEVIVVDQTTPELKRNGLHCVKVLIPGMLPMTFGHHLTRVSGLERILKVPEQLGFTKRPLTYGEINPHPHPFP